jgi:copper chaperone CopZ
MKKVLTIMGIMIAFMTQTTFAQSSGKQFIEIKTSAQCGTCKAAIETAVTNIEGVKSADLDLDTKVVSVKFDAEKTNAEAIKTAITKVGYTADEVPADKVAYDNLHPCCKAPETK